MSGLQFETMTTEMQIALLNVAKFNATQGGSWRLLDKLNIFEGTTSPGWLQNWRNVVMAEE